MNKKILWLKKKKKTGRRRRRKKKPRILYCFHYVLSFPNHGMSSYTYKYHFQVNESQMSFQPEMVFSDWKWHFAIPDAILPVPDPKFNPFPNSGFRSPFSI